MILGKIISLNCLYIEQKIIFLVDKKKYIYMNIMSSKYIGSE